MVELADTSDLGSDAERFGGSNPLARNEKENSPENTVFLGFFFVFSPKYPLPLLYSFIHFWTGI